MIDRGKKNLLGVLVDAVDYEAATSRIFAAARAGKAMSVSALAVHGVMTGVLDDTQRYRLNHLDLVVPDGQPVRWALNLLHDSKLPDRVYGPTLMIKVCEEAAKERLPLYFYGSSAAVVEKLRDNLLKRFPGLLIVGAQPSKFKRISLQEKESTVESIRSSGAAITFVGLGCPRQDVWVYEYRESLNMPLLAVGAAFDFHAGTLKQAPPFLQRMGLEWLFRLMKEPFRLWKRYLLLNPLYLMLIFLQATHLRTFDRQQMDPPKEEVRYG